jgi:pyruvate/2-oxoglutarate dehydrogenase complex dihydrolipoamide dehydrogenase (E3) component
MSGTFDAIIIGTGQAGPPLAKRLASAGMKVAIAERKRFGGTCVNTGCTPTKALVASARAAHVARRSADFGVVIEVPARVDMKHVKARKDALVKASTEGVEKSLRETENVTVLHDHARFEGPRKVWVGDELIEAERIFVNVGARARVPPIPGIDDVPYLTDSSIMEVDFLPEHLIVLGGGYVGLEFAQMYRRFGSEVTVVQRAPRLIPKEDEDVSEAVREILEGEGIRVITSAPDYAAIRVEGEIRLEAEDGEPARVEGSHLLLAVGRMPNTDDLGLDAAGVETDDKGHIKVDDRLRTNVKGIWALGDCNGRGAFTHTAYDDFRTVAAYLLDGADGRVSDRIPAHALYIDPPLARVGMSEAEARASGRSVLAATLPMRRVARARERSETQGFMRVLVDADSERILGAMLLGIEADEVIHLILDVMYADKPYTLIRDAMHIHPTVSELIPTLLEDLNPLV